MEEGGNFFRQGFPDRKNRSAGELHVPPGSLYRRWYGSCPLWGEDPCSDPCIHTVPGTMRRFRAPLAGLLPAVLLCIMTLPDPLLAARLELRVRGTDSSAATTVVGDIVDVDVWVHSENVTLSGAAVFLSFDGDVFELVEQDQNPAAVGFQPFARGTFFTDGEIFRNTLLDPDDPAASPTGGQLDYSVVRANDVGAGPVAVFHLRALSPAAGSTIRIDESGIRETRYFMPDGSHESFRFITPLTIDVRGISIEGLPEQIVLSRGQVDSTSFPLDQILFDPVYSPQEISWHVDATDAVDARIDLETRRLIISAPADRSLWEQLTLRAVNPDGQTATAIIDLFVNAGPVIGAAPDTLSLSEDGDHRLSIDALVEDPDTPDAQLTWTVSASPELGARLEGTPRELVLEPRQDWSGVGHVTLTVMDRFGFADSTDFDVRVWAVNDAPRSLFSPNLRITRGKSDSTLVVANFFADVDDAVINLDISWTNADRVGITRRNGRLVVTAPNDWEGSEVIQLTVTDAQGAWTTAPLTVTVVASLAPAVTGAPQRLGVAAGESSVLDLKEFVTDPDDPSGALTWSVTGNVELLIQVSTTGAVRIEAPAGFEGTETVRFLAIDPSGESAWFDLLVFGAPAGGEPLVAPLPAISLPPSGVNTTIDLDDYVFDLDHTPQQLSWTVSGPAGLELRVDGVSHVLTVIAADSLAGDFEVDLLTVDPDGHQTTSTMLVFITSDAVVVEPVGPVDPVDPSVVTPITLAPLPTLHMTSGGFDQSLVLDGYIESGDPASVSWEAVSAEHVQVLVDNATRRVTVLAADGWTGPALILIRALDGAGDIVTEVFFGVQVDAAVAALSLREIVEIPVLQGDSVLTIDPATLLATGPDPASLTWEASGTRAFEVSWEEGYLVLHSGGFSSAGGEMVTIVARDDAGNQASGKLLVQVLPTDGSVGSERDGFRVTVVANPVNPAFLDLFVLSHTGVRPRLRSYLDDWSEMSLTTVADGIWHAPHALEPGMEGTVSFLALSLEEGQLTRSEREIHVGTVPAAAGKTIAVGDFSLEMDAGAFGNDAVVAVIPEAGVATIELEAVGSAYRVHATAILRSTPNLTLRTADPRALAYRWDATAQRWQFVGGHLTTGAVTIELRQLGRYALFTDRTAPTVADDGNGRLRVTDAGSGVAEVDVLVGGIPLSGALERDDDGMVFRLTDLVPTDATLDVRAVDRAGNVSTLRLSVAVADLLPTAFQLGQNYPNPFNPDTTIPLRVSTAGGALRLEVFNAAGQRIRTLVDEVLPAGQRSVSWDGRDSDGRFVSSGTYIYRAITDAGVHTRRMTLLR